MSATEAETAKYESLLATGEQVLLVRQRHWLTFLEAGRWFVLALVIPGVLGLLIALAAVRLRGLALAMVTIALPIVGVPLAKRFSDLTGGNEGISVRRLPYVGSDGETYRGNPFAAPGWTGLDNDQWAYWDRLTCEVMCLRGANSDLLSVATADEMTRRGPRCRVVTIAGCGHAPALNTPEQIAIVRDFLSGE